MSIQTKEKGDARATMTGAINQRQQVYNANAALREAMIFQASPDESGTKQA
jgi:hypothetical protein